MSCIRAHPREQDCPFASLRLVVTSDARDWSLGRRDAWLYGIVIGWDDESLSELKDAHRWTDAAVARLKRLHASFNSIHEAAHPSTKAAP